jgi:hypothetical protein
MPNPRLPVMKAETTGAAIKNPGRHRNRKQPRSATPLGAPSAFLKDGAITAWEGFRRELPWLTEGHRTLVEIASTIRGRLIDGEDVGISALSLLQVCLGKLGATPTDESKVNFGDEGGDPDPMFDA